MPPPGGICGMAGFGSGLSVIIASVVSTMAAIEAAFSTAERVTLAGSTMPPRACRCTRRSSRRSRRSCSSSRPARGARSRCTTWPSMPGVLGEAAHRLLERVRGRSVTPVSASPSSLSLSSDAWALMQRHAAAGHDALLDRRAGGGEGVLDAVLLLLELDLGGGADLDDRHAAGQLGQPLLELLLVVVGGRVLDLGLDLLDAALDLGSRAVALDDRRVVLVGDDAARAARGPSSSTESSLRPTSSLMTWPPVRMAMSRSISLRRSPKPGALTASTLTMPRSLLTTSVASASPSTSSAMISEVLLAGLEHLLERRQRCPRWPRSSCR